jgi:hypothetical protein
VNAGISRLFEGFDRENKVATDCGAVNSGVVSASSEEGHMATVLFKIGDIVRLKSGGPDIR